MRSAKLPSVTEPEVRLMPAWVHDIGSAGSYTICSTTTTGMLHDVYNQQTEQHKQVTIIPASPQLMWTINSVMTQRREHQRSARTDTKKRRVMEPNWQRRSETWHHIIGLCLWYIIIVAEYNRALQLQLLQIMYSSDVFMFRQGP